MAWADAASGQMAILVIAAELFVPTEAVLNIRGVAQYNYGHAYEITDAVSETHEGAAYTPINCPDLADAVVITDSVEGFQPQYGIGTDTFIPTQAVGGLTRDLAIASTSFVPIHALAWIAPTLYAQSESFAPSDTGSGLFIHFGSGSDSIIPDDLVTYTKVEVGQATPLSYPDLIDAVSYDDSAGGLLRHYGTGADSFTPTHAVTAQHRALSIFSTSFAPSDTANGLFTYLAQDADSVPYSDIVDYSKPNMGATPLSYPDGGDSWYPVEADLGIRGVYQYNTGIEDNAASFAEAIEYSTEASILGGSFSDEVQLSDSLSAVLRHLIALSEKVFYRNQITEATPIPVAISDLFEITESPVWLQGEYAVEFEEDQGQNFADLGVKQTTTVILPIEKAFGDADWQLADLIEYQKVESGLLPLPYSFGDTQGANWSDGAEAFKPILADFSDSWTATDSAAYRFSLIYAPSDSLSITDAAKLALSLRYQLSDEQTYDDSANKDLYIILPEWVPLPYAFSDSFSPTDAFDASRNHVAKFATEFVPSDSGSALFAYLATATDTWAPEDLLDAYVKPSETKEAQPFDSLTPLDSGAAILRQFPVCGDAITPQDVIAAQMRIMFSQTEEFAPVDGMYHVPLLARRIRRIKTHLGPTVIVDGSLIPAVHTDGTLTPAVLVKEWIE